MLSQIDDHRIRTAIEHQLEERSDFCIRSYASIQKCDLRKALNILNRQLFILSVGPGYKFLPTECEDSLVQFDKVKVFFDSLRCIHSDCVENN